MNITFSLLSIMAVTLSGAAVHAWRIGNERRDVVLLAVMACMFGVGAAAAAVALLL